VRPPSRSHRLFSCPCPRSWSPAPASCLELTPGWRPGLRARTSTLSARRHRPRCSLSAALRAFPAPHRATEKTLLAVPFALRALREIAERKRLSTVPYSLVLDKFALGCLRGPYLKHQQLCGGRVFSGGQLRGLGPEGLRLPIQPFRRQIRHCLLPMCSGRCESS